MTILPRPTENLTDKRKMYKTLKSSQQPSSQRRIQNSVKTGDKNSCKYNHLFQEVNYSLKKLHPRRSPALWISFCGQFNMAFNNAHTKRNVRLTFFLLIAVLIMLIIHQLCKYIYTYIYVYMYIIILSHRN